MQVYPQGTAVTVAVPFVDLSGNLVAPTAATVRVLDQTGAEIVGATPVAVTPGDAEAEVTIAGEHNVLSGLDPEMRVVEMMLETPAGWVASVVRYVIRQTQRLFVPQNSFQTFDEALLESCTMPRMEGWSVGNDDDRVAALIAAYDRLTRMTYRVEQPISWSMSRIGGFGSVDLIVPLRWPEMTTEEFRELPEHFRRALRRAQIAEADVVMNGDVIGGRRRSGLMSETIGESSMMFRPGTPLDLGVSEQALVYLSGYLHIAKGIGRA
jgi:hypothetical protein